MIVNDNLRLKNHVFTQVNGAYFIKSSNQHYQPFMYNTTTDFCRFLKNQNSLPFWKILYNIMKPYTNLNSTCPLTVRIITALMDFVVAQILRCLKRF